MTLRLGIIGKSVGNGHPYSWSAICNGYCSEKIKNCGYPAIPEYLKLQKWPESQLKDVNVTHVWTQDPRESKKIADATYINTIVKNPEDMIGYVDALLLARDDAENHLKLAKPFLEKGLPVYIDKPIAINQDDYKKLISLQLYPGQIFSCSALRFAPEMKLTNEVRKKLGPIRLVQGITPKYWKTYAVHLIDPLILNLGLNMNPEKLYSGPINVKGRTLSLRMSNGGPDVQLIAGGESLHASISLRIIGESYETMLTFQNSFLAFRNALEQFIFSVREKQEIFPEKFNRRVVQLIEMGL